MTTLILGGGITGLLAAYYLQERGETAEVWEAEATVGEVCNAMRTVFGEYQERLVL